ncbi:MAG: carbohydrate binding domain-containing protein, partial [Armatimonadetes bacterium]|nr:carbohydrate binding domain-containing protein [Armatimonadota bacterium]
MSKHLVYSVIIAVIFSLPVSAQQELLKNTSFEELTDKGVPAGWAQYGGGVPESVLKVETTARTGKSALHLIDTGPNERDNRYAIGVQQDVPVTPGRFYLASVWAKALARNHDQAVVLQLTFMGGPEAKNSATYILSPIGGDWKRYSVGAIAPEDSKSVRLYLYTMHYWTSDTLLDDASLKEADASQSVATAVFQWGQEPLAGPRKLKLQTTLTKGGQPAAAIACPSDAEWQKAAQELQTAIQRKTGATLPIHLVSVVAQPDGKDNRAALSALLKTDQTILALGNVNNSFIMERLYWNFYTQAHSLWPGRGAFALRTVHQPFNFADINVLTIEASDLDGAKAGVTELARRLPDSPDCALDKPLLFVSSVKPMNDEQRQKLLAGKPSPSLLLDFHRACVAYRESGDEAWALQAKRLMGLCRDRLVADPQYKLDWPEETSSCDIGKLWDVIEEAPVWTDAERRDAENVLFATLLGMRRNVYNWGSFAKNDTIVWNHQTFPLLGVYWLARWFERHYPGQEPIADYLAQVHGAFRGQLKSWKPQCDADSYLTITPRHTIEYTLSRNDYRFFESGNVRTFAEYLTGVCDNVGNTPGFGDSGYGKGPGYELNGLPIAFWYYRDPRYLWRLQQIYDGKWPNPYHTDIEPKPWPEIVGVNVYRMPEEYYKWATTFPSYGEGVTKTDVTYEQSFDKISFREQMAEDGQFVLLDGFARGKHLQYDGNSIIRYHAHGEDWLIDGDYLVRNTTDHSMISVVRDGRCATLEPAFTRLDAHADLPGVGYTRTTVTDYNGADWTRHILWLKGEGFVVVDELTAREAGDYTFENVYKMLDLGKLQFDGRCVKVSRPTGGGMGSRDLTYTQAEGVGKVVRFGSQSSRMEFPVTLPAGEYAVTLFGQGTSGGTDSFYLTIDDSEPVACHVPIEQLGPSSSSWTKDTPTPNVKIGADGLHLFRITLREGPGTMLHKVVIADKTGKEVQ